VGVHVLCILCRQGWVADTQHVVRGLLLRRLGVVDASRHDHLAADDPHLLRRHVLLGIHRRWHPVMRQDVRGGLWLRAVVVIAEDVDATTPLMGIDPHLGDGAAVTRSARPRRREVT
jgi:hypothetical protein